MNKIPDHLVIAHRGTTYWAPEETEAAMRWARNIGADYLELDLQRTKDGYLIALHDESLMRTTNIAEVFPDRKGEPVSGFTYSEILKLDAGNWFNINNPDRKREAFIGQEILLLEDIANIARGKRLKRDKNGKRIFETDTNGKLVPVYENDPADNGNRPGLYVETKIPVLFPGIENELYQELIRLGFYSEDNENLPLEILKNGKVVVGNSAYRLILQTFSKESLCILNKLFDRKVPVCFLLWRGNEFDDLPNDSIETYKEWLIFGYSNGASIIGPSINGVPNNYVDLVKNEHIKAIKELGLEIHAYSFDTWEQMQKYSNSEICDRVDSMFTNRAEQAIAFYRKYFAREVFADPSAEKVLVELGY